MDRLFHANHLITLCFDSPSPLIVHLSSRVIASWFTRFLCTALLVSRLSLLLLLRRLQRHEVDESDQSSLQAQADDDENHGCEELRLIVEDGNGLLRRADRFEKVEFAHFDSFLIGMDSRW